MREGFIPPLIYGRRRGRGGAGRGWPAEPVRRQGVFARKSLPTFCQHLRTAPPPLQSAHFALPSAAALFSPGTASKAPGAFSGKALGHPAGASEAPWGRPRAAPEAPRGPPEGAETAPGGAQGHPARPPESPPEAPGAAESCERRNKSLLSPIRNTKMLNTCFPFAAADQEGKPPYSKTLRNRPPF